MGFLDKAKEAAEKAVAATQQAAQQGQAKIEELQASKSDGDLLKALGEAFYNEQRHGGARVAVEVALAAVDAHRAAAPPASAPPAAAPSAAAPAQPAEGAPDATAPTPAPPAAAPVTPPAGNFTLDDL